MWCQYQNQEKTHRTLQTIVPLLSPAVFVRLWNVWSITDLSGTWKEKIITPTQSGYRKGRSTTDQLVRLESFIREAFIQKQHATAIFFDLQKGVRYNLEVRHLERLTWRWSTRPTPTFHSWLPLTGSSKSELVEVIPNSVKGSGGTSGKHPICYFVLFEN